MDFLGLRYLVVLATTGAILLLTNCRGEQAPVGRKTMNTEDCYRATGVELGVPEDAVFFLAEIAVAPEPLANRRWAVKADGVVLFGENSEPFDFQQLPGKPFNRPFGTDPIAQITREDLEGFVAWLKDQGVFHLPGEINPPEGVRVNDGVDRWIVVRDLDQTACVRMRPGATLSDAVDQRFSDVVNKYIRPPRH